MDIKYIPTDTEVSDLMKKLPWPPSIKHAKDFQVEDWAANVKRNIALFIVVQFNTIGNNPEQVLNNAKVRLFNLIK